MVYNPIESQRQQTVTARLSGIGNKNVRVFDDDGNEIKSQVINRTNTYTEILFIADVKSLGTRIYDARVSDIPCDAESAVSISKNRMENQKYIVTLNPNGDIASIIDKEQNNFQILKEPVSLGLLKYNGSRVWPAWEMDYNENKNAADRIPVKSKMQIIEKGPCRVAFKVTQRDKKSTFTNIIALSDGGKCVEVYSEIEWQSLRTLAKEQFSFNVSNGTATFDLGLGAIKRQNMCDKLYEVPAQNWADITDKNGKSGVSVNYRIDSMQSMMDLGLNRYSFAIFSHKGDVGTDTQLEARKFITPMTAYICKKHNGALGTNYSFGSVSSNDVIVRAIKKPKTAMKSS